MNAYAVGRIEHEVSDDQCEERPSDEGNAADEFEADYEHWLRVRQKTPRARAAGLVGAVSFRPQFYLLPTEPKPGDLRVQAYQQRIPWWQFWRGHVPRWSVRQYLVALADPDLSPDDALRLFGAALYQTKWPVFDGPAVTERFADVDWGQVLRSNPAWMFWLLESPNFPQRAQNMATFMQQEQIARDFLPAGQVSGRPVRLSKKAVEEALRQEGGDVSRAAAKLQANRNYVSNLAKKYELDIPWTREVEEASRALRAASQRQRLLNEGEEGLAARSERLRQWHATMSEEEKRSRSEAKKADWVAIGPKGQEEQSRQIREGWAKMPEEKRAAHRAKIIATRVRRPPEIGRLSPEDETEVTEAIDRAYAWWFDTIGAIDPKKLAAFQARKIPPPGTTKATKEARRQYMQSLSIIREIPRDPGVPALSIIEGWYASATLQRECRRLFGHGPGFLNFLTTAENATIAEWNYWTRWYHHAHQDVQALSLKHRVPLDQVAAIIAVTSPGNQWPTNLAIADYILSGIKTKKDIKGSWKGTSAFPKNGLKVEQILMTASSDPIKGPKVEAFYLQLLDPETSQDFATVDGHMINLWLGLDQSLKFAPGLTSGEDAELRSDLDAAAKEVGIHTQEFQALAWYIWRYSINKEIIPANTLAAARDLVRDRLEEKADAARFRKERERHSLRQFLSEYAKGTYPAAEAMLGELDEEINEIDTGDVGAVRYLPVRRPRQRR